MCDFVCVCQISFKYLHGAFYIYIIKYIYISLKYHFLFTSFFMSLVKSTILKLIKSRATGKVRGDYCTNGYSSKNGKG